MDPASEPAEEEESEAPPACRRPSPLDAAGGASAEGEPCAPEVPPSREAAPAAAEGPPGAAAPPLAVGDRVLVQGLVEKERLNGANGVLVAMTGDRWQVRLDGKGRWLLKAACLVKVDLPPINLRDHAVNITGTWDNWAVHKMRWDEADMCYVHEVRIGKDKEASFQILIDADWKRCLHPDKNDASPHSAYNLCGPDAHGHEKNWTIGKHPADKAVEGSLYRIFLRLRRDGNPLKVEWAQLSAGDDGAPAATLVKEKPNPAAEVHLEPNGSREAALSSSEQKQQHESDAVAPVCCSPYQSVSIVGEFNSWNAREMMVWDESRQCYHFKVRLGYQQQESFQILLDGDWNKCVHPDDSDGCPYLGSVLCGPDNDGHNKNWTIGLHPRDRSARGVSYEVRLFLAKDGSPEKVDWLRLDKDGNYDLAWEEQYAPVKLPKHNTISIIGSWNHWRPQDMKWDSDRLCYYSVMEVGAELQESFQLWVDGDAAKCLHPRSEDGSPFTENKLCGPDGAGHGKNWTIGLHFLEKADRGVQFEVRLFLTEDGSARFVDWARVPPGIAKRAG